jgi:hypothetical protein
MAYASIAGRAHTDPSRPRAQGVCQRCGMWYQLDDLVYQYAWRGNDLVNIQLRVCTRTCLDIPFQCDRPLYIPPDPPPVDQPRIETFALDEEGPQTWDGENEYWDSGLTWDANINNGSNKL